MQIDGTKNTHLPQYTKVERYYTKEIVVDIIIEPFADYCLNKGENPRPALNMYGGIYNDIERVVFTNRIGINSLSDILIGKQIFTANNNRHVDTTGIKPIEGVAFTTLHNCILFLSVCVARNKYGLFSFYKLLAQVRRNGHLCFDDLIRFNKGLMIGFPHNYNFLETQNIASFEYITPYTSIKHITANDQKISTCTAFIANTILPSTLENITIIERYGYGADRFTGSLDILDENTVIKTAFENAVRLYEKTIPSLLLDLSTGTTELPMVVDSITQELSIKLTKKYGSSPHEVIQKVYRRALQRLYCSNLITSFQTIVEFYRRCRMENIKVEINTTASPPFVFLLYLLNLIDINPLLPHYLCDVCNHTEFDLSVSHGCNLTPKQCPYCGSLMNGDGHCIKYYNYDSGFSTIDISFWVDENDEVAAKSIKNQYLLELYEKAGSPENYHFAFSLELLDLTACHPLYVNRCISQKLEQLTGVATNEIPYNFCTDNMFIEHAEKCGVNKVIHYGHDEYLSLPIYRYRTFCVSGDTSMLSTPFCFATKRSFEQSWYYYNFKTEYYTAFLSCYFKEEYRKHLHSFSKPVLKSIKKHLKNELSINSMAFIFIETILNAMQNDVCFAPSNQHSDEPFSCCGNVIIYHE